MKGACIEEEGEVHRGGGRRIGEEGEAHRGGGGGA